jgi:Cu/Ag efflux protein CusF
MSKAWFACRAWVVATYVAVGLGLLAPGSSPASAQASRFWAEVVKVEVVERRLTLKASMGQQTLRVAPGVALDALKAGDKVLLTFGQDGSESIITSIEVIKP